MSTRALVVIRDSFGGQAAVYRGSDGYPEEAHGVLAGLAAAAPAPGFRAADFAAALVRAWSAYGCSLADPVADAAWWLDYSYVVMPGPDGALGVVVSQGRPARFEVVRPAAPAPAPARRSRRRLAAPASPQLV